MFIVDDLYYLDYLLMENMINYHHFIKDFLEVNSNFNEECEDTSWNCL